MNRTKKMAPGLVAIALLASACGGDGNAAVETTEVSLGETPATDAPTTEAPTTEASANESSDDDAGSAGGLQSSVDSGGSGESDTEPDSDTETTQAPERTTTSEATTITDDGEEVGVFSLSVGDCLADVGLDSISSVTELSCEAAHVYEIYHAYDIPGDAYPGDDAVVTSAQDNCLAEFEPFVGTTYDDSELDVSYLYPTMESWTLGDDREVLCMLVTVDGSPRTGSAEGLGI